MSLVIPDEVRERVNEALNEGFPLAFHAVSADSQPIVSFRGSAQTHGDDSLAIWVRSDPSATLEAIAQNPSVVMTYTNMPARKFWIFRGQASLVTDEAQRNQIGKVSTRSNNRATSSARARRWWCGWIRSRAAGSTCAVSQPTSGSDPAATGSCGAASVRRRDRPSERQSTGRRTPRSRRRW